MLVTPDSNSTAPSGKESESKDFPLPLFARRGYAVLPEDEHKKKRYSKDVKRFHLHLCSQKEGMIGFQCIPFYVCIKVNWVVQIHLLYAISSSTRLLILIWYVLQLVITIGTCKRKSFFNQRKCGFTFSSLTDRFLNNPLTGREWPGRISTVLDIHNSLCSGSSYLRSLEMIYP